MFFCLSYIYNTPKAYRLRLGRSDSATLHGCSECRRARDTFWDRQVAKMTALGNRLCAPGSACVGFGTSRSLRQLRPYARTYAYRDRATRGRTRIGQEPRSGALPPVPYRAVRRG